jgi:hypothetical protein
MNVTSFMTGSNRIQLQDIVRKTPSHVDQEIIDEKREALAAMFVQLTDLQSAAGIIENKGKEKVVLDDETEYDDYEEPTVKPVPHLTPIERKTIVLPSNGNVETNPSASDLEIKFRKMQAHSQLNRIRDLIADISFQFSHVIRGQIRKNIRTRSQKRVKSLHDELTLQARIYTRCRNHLVALDCGQSILGQYRELKKEDLKSSTAILEPNQPGSTSLKLSWIWHSGRWLLMQEISTVIEESDQSSGPREDSDPAPGPRYVSHSATGPGPESDGQTLFECRLSLFSNTS